MRCKASPSEQRRGCIPERDPVPPSNPNETGGRPESPLLPGRTRGDLLRCRGLVKEEQSRPSGSLLWECQYSQAVHPRRTAKQSSNRNKPVVCGSYQPEHRPGDMRIRTRARPVRESSCGHVSRPGCPRLRFRSGRHARSHLRHRRCRQRRLHRRPRHRRLPAGREPCRLRRPP